MFLYDLSGLEKAGDLAREKSFSPSLLMDQLALIFSSVPMSSTVLVGLLSLQDKQTEYDAA